MARFFGYGTLQPVKEIDISFTMAELRKVCDGASKGNFNGTVRQGNETFVITREMCSGFLIDVMECALVKVGVRDGDYAKYSISHLRKMLL